MSLPKHLSAEIVAAVHANDEYECHRLLGNASKDDLMGVAVVLAASVRMDDPLMAHWKPPLVPVAEIIAESCVAADVELEDFYSDRKLPANVRARHIASWVGALAGYTYAELGRQMKRDHSTVMNGVDRVTRDPELHRLAVQVLEKIGHDRVRAAAQEGRGA